MKKKRQATFFLVAIVSSVVLLVNPTHSWAKNTTMTITFSDQERKSTVVPPVEVPLIKQTKVKKDYEVSFFAESDQRLTRSYQRRLPTTGEEYNTVLSCLGWVTVLFILFFFFIGNYERKGRDSRE